MEPTKIEVEVAAHVNLGDFEWLEKRIVVTDHVRPGVDENAGAAIDRIHGLAETKLASYIEEYGEKDSGQ